jgi:peroxiredoxin
MRGVVLPVSLCAVFLCVAQARAVDPYAGGDPYWILIHEPAVVAELKLSTKQQRAYQTLTDDLDPRFFPLRNKPREEATAGLKKLVEEAQQRLKDLLQPKQQQRLTEIVLWRLSTAALLRDDVAERLKFSGTQRKMVRQIADETQQDVAAIEKQVSEGKPRAPLEKEFRDLKTEEQKLMLALLKPEQRTGWKQLLGENFDVAKLGQPAFKAPELIDTKEWINTKQPLQLARLRGKVVIVHFYACGCINCIHNYPSYRKWQEELLTKDVVMIGIHTPETEGERNLTHVRRKAAEEKLKFPILIDVKSDYWNAWGNSMWPSVYVIDKRGYLRNFWPGELKWQGSDGEKFLTERIEQLVAEPGT